VQEYGESPTGIFMSHDLENWRLLVSSRDIDKTARHFHSIAYDRYHDLLIVTLGDGNYVRVAVSSDQGKNWRPAYKGAWQSVPIVVLEDHVVFGMDSDMSSGILTWRPEVDKWKTTHLKWRGGRVRVMQMVDLRYLDEGIWMAALGAPQGLIVSPNLKEWYPIYMEGFDVAFNHSICLSEGKNVVASATGNSMIAVEKDYLAEKIGELSPIACEYKAIYRKLIGSARDIKEGLLHATF